jgi:serine/threonine protein kinase
MQNNVCYNCYNYIPAGSVVCPFCGYNAADDAGRFPLALPPGTSLGGRYVVGRVLGQGGFGITYMALDCVTRQRAAIKEYFPESMAARTVFPIVTPNSRDREENFAYGKSCFLEEAKTLAEFIGDPNIVMVQGCFEENGTAYFVMDYVEGESLQDYARRRGGTVDWQTAKSIMYPVMRALAVVHSKGIVHRDVAPDNIFITTDGSIKLLDFGAARYSLGDRSRSLDVVLKHGFAPKEQYARHGRQGPFTDVYAVAASMYFIITGRVPPDSIDRMEHDELIPPSVLGADIPPADEHALLTALAVQTADRYKTMNEFLTALYPAYAQRQNYPPSQSVEQSYSQNQPIRQNYPPSQSVEQSYPQNQPIRQSYTPSQPIEQSYPQSQPIRQNYPPSQPIAQSYPQNQPIRQSYTPSQPIAQSYPQNQPIRQSYTPSQPEEDDTEQTMPPEHFAIPKAESQQPVYGTSGMYGSETPAPAPQTPQPQTVSRQQKASENPRLKRKAAAAAAAVVLLTLGGIIAVKAFGNRDSGESAEKTTTVMTPAPVTTSASFTDVSLPDSSEFNSSGDYSESDTESNIDPPVHHNGTADNIVIMYNGYQCSGSFTGTLYGGDVPDGEGVFTASYTDDDNDLHNITCTGRFVNGEMTGDFTARDICGGEVFSYTGALVGGMMHGKGKIEVTFENGTKLVQEGYGITAV